MRFNLKQLLLLFILFAILGGLLTAVFRRPQVSRYVDLAASPSGQTLAAVSSTGLDLIDVNTQSYRTERIGSNMLFQYAEDQALKFIDDDRIAMVTEMWAIAGRVVQYSISERRMLSSFDVQSQVGMNSIEIEFSKRLICVNEQRFRNQNLTSKIEFLDLSELTPTAKRLLFPFKVIDVTASDDGELIAISTEKTKSNRIWNWRTDQTVCEWSGIAKLMTFSADARLLAFVDDESFAVLDVSLGQKIWSHPKKGQLSKAKILFCDGGKQLMLIHENGNLVEQVTPDTGEVTKSIRIGKPLDWWQNQAVTVSEDGKTVFAGGKSSDDGIRMFDVETETHTRTIGRYSRALLAFLFSFLLCSWPAVWWFFSDRSPDAQESDSLPTYFSNARKTLKTVRRIMFAGGVFGIFFTVIPMFYSNVLFSTTISSFRVFLFTVGTLTSVSALYRAINVGRRGYRTIAAFQIYCFVNLDVINGVLGIINTILLNRSDVCAYLKNEKVRQKS